MEERFTLTLDGKQLNMLQAVINRTTFQGSELPALNNLLSAISDGVRPPVGPPPQMEPAESNEEE